MAIKLSSAVVCFLLSMGLTLSCSKPKPMPTTMRSVYYWSTTLNMDSVKTAFMRNYDISRMYIRYFDVVADQSGRAVPNATLKFATDVPQGIDIVPTVFVMPECLRQDRQQLAALIVKRVVQMNETNDVGQLRQLQID